MVEPFLVPYCLCWAHYVNIGPYLKANVCNYWGVKRDQIIHSTEQAMITLQEMAVFNSLYGLLAAKLIFLNYLMIITFFFFFLLDVSYWYLYEN